MKKTTTRNKSSKAGEEAKLGRASKAKYPKAPNHFQPEHKEVWDEWVAMLVDSKSWTLEVKNLLISYAWAMGEMVLRQKSGREMKSHMMVEVRRTGEYLCTKVKAKVDENESAEKGFGKFK